MSAAEPDQPAASPTPVDLAKQLKQAPAVEQVPQARPVPAGPLITSVVIRSAQSKPAASVVPKTRSAPTKPASVKVEEPAKPTIKIQVPAKPAPVKVEAPAKPAPVKVEAPAKPAPPKPAPAKPLPVKLEKAAKPLPVKLEKPAKPAPIKVETSLVPKPAEELTSLTTATSAPPALDALALPAMPPVPPETDDNAPRPLLPQPEKVRTAAILVATAVLATLGWVGVYLMAFGSGDAAADVASAQNSVPVGLTPGGTADFVIDPTTGKKLSTAARARAAAAELPTGQLTQQQKRIALQNYTAAIGLDLTNAASPTTAARSACRLLGTGTEPEDLVKGVAKGGKIARAKSRAFLLGATLLYCPTESKPFKR